MPDESGVSIPQAYEELSIPAFACWIRMMLFSDNQLTGRANAAAALGYSLARFNRILRELRNKGYVDPELPHGPGMPTRIRFRRRVLLSGRDRIIKLSAVTTSRPPTRERVVRAGKVGGGTHSPVKKPSRAVKVPWQGSATSLAESTTRSGVSKIHTTTPCGPRTAQRANGPTGPQPKPQDSVFDLGVGVAFASGLDVLDVGLCGVPPLGGTHRRAGKEKAPPDDARPKAKAGVPDWKRLKVDAGKIRNALGLDLAKDEELIATLELPATHKKRKALEELLGEAFGKVYRSYRYQRQSSSFLMTKEMNSKAIQAGVLCVAEGILPEVLIEYWDRECGRFTAQRFPSLSFLAAPGNVGDAAATVGPAAVRKSPTEAPRGSGRAGSPTAVDARHGYADPSRLHPDIRPGLEGAGFDLGAWDDRALLTIQGAARALANGVDMSMSKSMRGMADWVAEHVFGGDHAE